MRYLLHTLPPSIPYTAAIHVFFTRFYSKFFSMSILGAKHTVSVLFVWFLADLGITPVLSFCTVGLLGKTFVHH